MTHQRRLTEQFPLEPRDPIRRELRKILGVLDARLAAYDKLQVAYDAVVEEARLMGLSRINDTLTPLLQDAVDRLHNVTKLFSGVSESTFELATGEVQFEIVPQDRALFVPLDFVIAAVAGDSAKWAYGRVLGFDREAGLLTVDILTFAGVGSYSNWIIQASPPLDAGHAARTDNPHLTTAAQVGAYTVAEADAAIAAAVTTAVNALIAGAPGALDTLNELAAALGDDANFAATVATALALRLRVDAAQAFTSPQKSQAQSNLGVSEFAKSLIAVPDMATAMRVIGARGPKNLLFNPGFLVSQRYGGVSQTGFSGITAVDGYRVSNGTGCTFATNQIASSFGHTVRSPYYLYLTITSGDASITAAEWFGIGAAIEGLDIVPLKWGIGPGYGKPMLVRMVFLPPMAGTFHVALQNHDSTRSYVHPITFSAGDVGQLVVRSFVVPPDDNAGSWLGNQNKALTLYLILAAGTNFHTATPDAWVSGLRFATAAQSNGVGSVMNWALADWGLYEAADLVAGQAPQYELPPFADVLARCQRYYEHSWDYGTVRGALTSVGSHQWSVSTSGIASISTSTHVEFKTTKRVTPTVNVWSPATGNTNYGRDANYGEVVVNPVVIGTNGVGLQPATGPANAQHINAHWSADASLT
jgi:hypothetical protein